MPRFRPGMELPGRPGWTLVEPLGSGGFGEVWKAAHDFYEPRAVKFCTDPAARQRLLTHEGKLVARVMKEGRHPNVVALLDDNLSGEVPWLAYEYVGGGDLTGLILSWHKFPPGERVRRALEALTVLAGTAGHFHALTPPLVHRDLKPANILVAADGSLRITDFGIGGIAAVRALFGSRDGQTAYTRAVSMLAGAYTPIYASPQQQRGDQPDPRDDVHALGVILYQMLSGRLDAGPGPRFDRELQRLSIAADIIELVGDCVDSDPSHRPDDAAVLGRRLAARLAASTGAPAPSGPVQVRATADLPNQGAATTAARSAGAAGSKGSGDRLPFPDIKMDNFHERVRTLRQRSGHPADGRDIVYVFRATPVGGGSHHPLFALPPDAVRALLTGALPPEQSSLYIHRDLPSGKVGYEPLAPETVSLIDPDTGTVPTTAPRRGRAEAEALKECLRQRP